MYRWQKNNIKITEESKILIGLGDSFTQGEGACLPEIWEKYGWDVKNMSDKFSRDEINKSNMENSWVHKICEKHLPDYIPINMGMTGRGNRGAIKELYLHPDLKLETAKEKIVVFMITAIERFDFVHKHFFNHVHYYTMWPTQGNNDIEEKPLWDAYREFIFSDRSAVLELLVTIAELKNWCKLNNATLVLTSAFRPEYGFRYFFDSLRGDNENFMNESIEYIGNLCDIIDWDDFLRPKGFNCITDYLCHLENREDLILDYHAGKYYDYAATLEKLSPKGYITKCAHPSYLGHEAIADVIYEHINKIKNKKNGKKKIPTNII
jgi:hypothetical protein